MSRTDKDLPYEIKVWDNKTAYHSSDCLMGWEPCDIARTLKEYVADRNKAYRDQNSCDWWGSWTNLLTRYSCKDCDWCLESKMRKFGKRSAIRDELRDTLKLYNAGQPLD